MEVKLVITASKKEDPVNAVGKTYVFKDAPIITIGRGEPNDVPLIDPGRTVSRTHTQLVASDNGYALKDLDSKNFSFVNEERITSDRPRLLQNGDTIKVGDFCMEYSFLVNLEDQDVTTLDPLLMQADYDKNNPFDDAVKNLVDAFDQLSNLYDAEQLGDKNGYLNHSIKNALPAFGEHNVFKVFLNQVSDTQISEATQTPPPPAPQESPSVRSK